MPACLSSLFDDACLLSALPVQHLLVVILADDARYGQALSNLDEAEPVRGPADRFITIN